MKFHKKAAAIALCVVLAVAIIASLVSVSKADTTKADTTKEDNPLYSVTYQRVGGTDENPIYAYEFTWHGEEPLVIDSNGWHIGEPEGGTK